MLADYFGQPNAPYYFLKRTYEATHIAVKLPEIIWAAGEKVPVNVNVMHAPPPAMNGLQATVTIYDDAFKQQWRQARALSLTAGPSVTNESFGEYAIPADYADRFFFVVAELKGTDGKLVSRSVYWPRVLKQMSDAAFREKYRATPQPALTFDQGPWLKPRVAATMTQLQGAILSTKQLSETRGQMRVRIKNTGTIPAFNTQIRLTGVKRAFHATDNFFWLAPGEEHVLELEILWREPRGQKQARLTVEAWNAIATNLN